MEINLLPKQPFIVKHFYKFVLLLLIVLLLLAFTMMHYVMNQEKYLEGLQLQVNELEEKKEMLEENMKWNQKVFQKEEELKSFLKYKSLIQGIRANQGALWSHVLSDLSFALPEHGDILEVAGEGNQVTGKAVVYTLEDAAYFMQRLEEAPAIEQVYLQVVNEPAVYQQYYFDPQKVKILEFTFYKRDRIEKRDEVSEQEKD